MKKAIRLFAALLCMIFVCASFSGCKKIDEQKNKMGYFDENNNIILNGVKYKEFVIQPEMFIDVDYQKEFTIAKKDMPVIAAMVLGDNYYMSDDGRFLANEEVYSSSVYCREDVCDELNKAMLSDIEYTKYMYTYEVAGEGMFDDWKTYKYVFTDEQSKALDAVYSIKETIKGTKADRIVEISKYCADVYACSDDLIFREKRGLIYELNGDYYVEKWDEENDGAITNELIKVPDEYKKTFDDIMSDCKKSYDIDMF